MTKVKTDALGNRMKKYENITRFSLPPRTYTILRVDGRAFHTWTKKLTRPYDTHLMDFIDAAGIALCEQIPGAQFAYTQSDEISVLAVDFLDIKSQSWFDGVIQKWVSVGASLATAAFNFEVAKLYYMKQFDYELPKRVYPKIADKRPNAAFDGRVYSIPDFIEVENYFIWRQNDAIRNSVTMLAQAYATHRELQGKNVSQRHEIIHDAGDNWAKHPSNFKNGRVIRRRSSEEIMKLAKAAEFKQRPSNWFVDEATPVFTKNRDYLRDLVPIPWDDDVIVRKAASGK